MIVTWTELAARRQEWRKTQKKVVFTNGCFDLIHLGHLRYLEAARKLGDLLVLGLNSDQSVRILKGPLRPLVSQQERAELTAALRPVDFVVIFEEQTAEKIVAELQPDIYVKGGDYSLSGKVPPEAQLVRAYGGEVKFIPFLPGHSTSDLISRIVQLYAANTEFTSGK